MPHDRGRVKMDKAVNLAATWRLNCFLSSCDFLEKLRLRVLLPAVDNENSGAFFASRLVMPLLIDGYNLLHASGILGRGRGRGALARSRTALLDALAESLSEEESSRTIVVFDARNPPWGFARSLEHRGITVYFASRHEDADSMIEELIKTNSTPRTLVVVSSDHRLHRAARRRRATAVDSDRWFRELVRARAERQGNASQEALKPQGPYSPGEVEFWLRRFGIDAETNRDQGKQPD